MLQNQLASGNNGLIKTKYLTFGIDADSIKAAEPRLERIETDILNNFTSRSSISSAVRTRMSAKGRNCSTVSRRVFSPGQRAGRREGEAR